jgi:hypothetical protein
MPSLAPLRCPRLDRPCPGRHTPRLGPMAPTREQWSDDLPFQQRELCWNGKSSLRPAPRARSLHGAWTAPAPRRARLSLLPGLLLARAGPGGQPQGGGSAGAACRLDGSSDPISEQGGHGDYINNLCVNLALRMRRRALDNKIMMHILYQRWYYYYYYYLNSKKIGHTPIIYNLNDDVIKHFLKTNVDLLINDIIESLEVYPRTDLFINSNNEFMFWRWFKKNVKRHNKR